MEVDGRVAYEIALNKVLEKEKQIIELMSAYNQAMQLVESLQGRIEELEDRLSLKIDAIMEEPREE